MKSKHVFLVLCGAAGVVHCGGRLDVGETGTHPPASSPAGSGGMTSASAGKSGLTAGKGGGGGSGGAPSHAGTGNPNPGDAGERGVVVDEGGADNQPAITAGAGGDDGQIEHGGQGGTSGGGTGGGAGMGPTPCDCGSTTALTAINCQEGSTYAAYASNDGKVVLYIGTTEPYADSNVTSSESGLWTADDGTVYTGSRSAFGLSADGQTALLGTASGLEVLRTLAGKDSVVPLSDGYLLSADGMTVAGTQQSGSDSKAATWTAAGGVVIPNIDASDGEYPLIRALSADGSVLAGVSRGPARSALRRS